MTNNMLNCGHCGRSCSLNSEAHRQARISRPGSQTSQTLRRCFWRYLTLAKYPSVGRVSAMVLCCHVQSHKNRPVCWYASWNFAHSSTVFRSLNELIPLTSSVEVAGSSTLPAHKNTYELEHRNCVIKMFFQHQSVTHLP